METTNLPKITITATINAPVKEVWKFWTQPEHISQWNQASDDWMTSKVENDLRPGGNFMFRMEAKNGSFSFDFNGIYDSVVEDSILDYTLGDNRKVNIKFETRSNCSKKQISRWNEFTNDRTGHL